MLRLLSKLVFRHSRYRSCHVGVESDEFFLLFHQDHRANCTLSIQTSLCKRIPEKTELSSASVLITHRGVNVDKNRLKLVQLGTEMCAHQVYKKLPKPSPGKWFRTTSCVYVREVEQRGEGFYLITAKSSFGR